MQGFQVQSNVGGTCILKKKGYNTALLIILLILGILLGLIYYLLCNDEVVMVRMVNSNNQTAPNFDIDSYCENCGAPLPKEVKFCSNCGCKLNVDVEQPAQLESEEVKKVNEVIEVNSDEN